jgi:hypothetical protein
MVVDHVIHDENKWESVTATIGAPNVWCEIHDGFLDRHGKLTVTHFLVSVTKAICHESTNPCSGCACTLNLDDGDVRDEDN